MINSSQNYTYSVEGEGGATRRVTRTLTRKATKTKWLTILEKCISFIKLLVD
jgi:hypothetical protein